MNFYEAVYLIDPTLDDERLAGVKTDLQTKIAAAGGREIREVRCERRELFAPVRKHNNAVLLIYGFQAPADAIGNLRTELKHNEAILRMSYLRVDHPAEPEPVAAEPAAAEAASAPVPESEPGAAGPETIDNKPV